MRRLVIRLAALAAAGLPAAVLAQTQLDEPQISRARGAAAVTAPDVPAARGAHLAPEQVGSVSHVLSRPAEASSPLSNPAQGRDVSTPRVAGHDRCDPTGATPAPAGCDRILERRTAEFSRPGPSAVSPEARLLLQPTPDPASSDAREAARVLGSGAVSDQLAAEAIAAATNQPPPATGSAPPAVVVVTPPK